MFSFLWPSQFSMQLLHSGSKELHEKIDSPLTLCSEQEVDGY